MPTCFSRPLLVVSVLFFVASIGLSSSTGFLGSEAFAQRNLKTAILKCSATEDDSFAVTNFAPTVGIDVSVGDDCAMALEMFLSEGFEILPGGSGPVFDPIPGKDSIIYTLVRFPFRRAIK